MKILNNRKIFNEMCHRPASTSFQSCQKIKKKKKKIIIYFTIERKIVIRINIRSFNYITQQLIYSHEIIRKYFDPSTSGWFSL